MQYKIKKNRKVRIIYNPALVEQPPEALFRDDTEKSLGRGCAYFFDHRNVPMVLKRYYRGGLIGRFIEKTYPTGSEERSRMWTEFRLLGRLHSMNLPVPEPVAARCRLTSPVTCQGELITRRIPDARTLLDAAGTESLPEQIWRDVGTTLRKFHDHNVYHADLNAANILLDNRNRIYLIDFDKGRINSDSSTSWKADNLLRLRRSLDKQKGLNPGLNFDDSDWQALLAGYG